MKVVLISAPYSSVSPAQREDITRSVEAAAMLLWTNGIAVVSPHLNSGHFSDHNGTEVHFRAGYVEIAKRCDAMLSLYSSKRADGCIAETNAVRSKGRPIFKDVKEVLKWAKE
jgi:hypothetical protein